MCRRFDATSSRTVTRCLQNPSELRRKSAHSQLPSIGSMPTEQRAVRACARSAAAGRVQTQQSTAWPADDLNLVRVGRRAAAKHRIERVALDRPVASVRDRQDVAHDALGRHAARPPVRAREQRLIGLALGDGDRVGLR